MTPSPPVASILIPTYNSPDTLSFAVDTARRQSVDDLEIVIVGDGVTAQSRAVIEALVELDARIRFLDLPKAPGRGERNRHAGVIACRSDLVVYLADDDLLLPWHVENLLRAAEAADVVQSLNSYIDVDEQLRLWPTDLADPERRAWHLADPPRNRVSITGTAHTRSSYLTLDVGWIQPPEGVWADLALWRQFFRLPSLRAITVREISAIQFPAPLHAERSPEALRALYEHWHEVTRSVDARSTVERLQREAIWRELVTFSAESTDRAFVWLDVSRRLEEAERELDDARAASERNPRDAVNHTDDAQQAHEERDALAREIEAMRATVSWRVTAPLRAVRAAVARLTRR